MYIRRYLFWLLLSRFTIARMHNQCNEEKTVQARRRRRRWWECGTYLKPVFSTDLPVPHTLAACLEKRVPVFLVSAWYCQHWGCHWKFSAPIVPKLLPVFDSRFCLCPDTNFSDNVSPPARNGMKEWRLLNPDWFPLFGGQSQMPC